MALTRDDAASADELGDHSKDHQRRKNGRHGGIEKGRILPGTHAENDHHHADRNRANGGEQEIPLEAFEGSLTPG
jgi:hypothetical protein